ncbi:tRNA dihydrouridine synthase DusB [Methylocaldum gracile]
MYIGPYRLANRLILAPMAGVTDRPFRMLCRRYGAALAISEMVSANPALRHDRKTLRRSDHAGEPEPRAVQILGNDPAAMADAARINADRGAQIIDINMGCPAKKVCHKAAGSALLRDERLVARILEAVVGAVEVPVTLKIRTGWDPNHRNAVTVAKIAENAGIRAITIHGRTRACGFSGQAEYLTIHQVKQTVGIPVIANGDVDSPEKAAAVLELTGADAVMIGRAALGNPWLFRRIDHFLSGSVESGLPGAEETRDVILEHLNGLYAFYGEHLGVRIARKHVGWYLSHLSCPPDFGPLFNIQDGANQQLDLINQLFNEESRKLAA